MQVLALVHWYILNILSILFSRMLLESRIVFHTMLYILLWALVLHWYWYILNILSILFSHMLLESRIVFRTMLCILLQRRERLALR